MSKYKNVILILISLVLFAYAGLISLYPSFVSKHFNVEDFQQKTLKTAGLDVTFNSYDVKIKPTLQTVIKLKDLQVKYPDKQPLLKVRNVELVTTPASVLFKSFDVKSLTLKNVKYDDQVLPNNENKLAFLPEVFDPSLYGAKKITVKPGPVIIKDLEVSYTKSEPYSYKTETIREVEYSKEQVKDFLSSLNFSHVDIK